MTYVLLKVSFAKLAGNKIFVGVVFNFLVSELVFYSVMGSIKKDIIWALLSDSKICPGS